MSVNEIVVISGKGGTGKTTLTASIIPFLDKVVIADCDVDAPDLHILLHPEKTCSEDFVGTKKAVIDYSVCTSCGLCAENCQFDAISAPIKINPMKCEGCGVCEYVCPNGALTLKDTVVGTLFLGETSFGPMVHARLIPGEETSGRLVSFVRNEAQRIACEKDYSTVLIDGSPGIGCNVISSITGASTVVVVTEPTKSGLHDLERVLDITEKFSGKTYVVINKYDLSEEMSSEIERRTDERGATLILKLPFHRDMVKAVTDKKIPSLVVDEIFKQEQWENFIEEIKTQC